MTAPEGEKSVSKRIAFALCLMLSTTAASAALSPQYEEWRKGPAQWIMTGDETRAWKNLKDDAAASAFIDLFWARRDPTPGTFENEFRADFDGRVINADKLYTEKRTRGALTDRGRALIVLGPPSRRTEEDVRATGSGYDANTLAGTGRLTGGREEWWYTRDVAKKWGAPEIYIVFVTKQQQGRVVRDTQRTDWGIANAGAIKAAIVNPDLKTVPEWAATGGLNPIAFRIVPDGPGAAASQSATSTTQATAQTPRSSSTPATVTATVPFPESFEPTGITRLTLSRTIYDIDLQSKTDPFAKLTTNDTFKASDELGWASQVCTGTNDEPNLRFQLRLSGTAAGETINRVGEPDEMVPDRIRALNGCYMLRGAIPLEGMSPGNYELELSILDPSTRRDTILKKAFRIE